MFERDFFAQWLSVGAPKVRDRKGTPKNLCDKDCAELSGELSGAIGLETLVLLGYALEFFKKFFGLFVRFFGCGVLFWPSRKGVVLIRGLKPRIFHLVVSVVFVAL